MLKDFLFVRTEGPVRQFIDSWVPILPRRKLLGDSMAYDALPLPAGISRDQAIDVIASTPYAVGAGEGIARRIGIPREINGQPNPEWNRVVTEWARGIATSQVDQMISLGVATPATAGRPAPTRTRRRR